MLARMPDEAHRRRLAAIAQGMEAAERESLARAAEVEPGRRIELALELSELVRKSSSNFEKPLPPSIAELWRKRRKKP
jgi:hypothetical protein